MIFWKFSRWWTWNKLVAVYDIRGLYPKQSVFFSFSLLLLAPKPMELIGKLIAFHDVMARTIWGNPAHSIIHLYLCCCYAKSVGYAAYVQYVALSAPFVITFHSVALTWPSSCIRKGNNLYTLWHVCTCQKTRSLRLKKKGKWKTRSFLEETCLLTKCAYWQQEFSYCLSLEKGLSCIT